MPDLDTRLVRERSDLLAAIDQPPLGRIRDRARAAGRRRRAAAGAGLLAVAATATLAVWPWSADPEPALPPADARPGLVYAAAGIAINGLTGGDVFQVPGTITDVQFMTPDIGFLLATCPAADPCEASVARTTDGGLTWQVERLPDVLQGRAGMGLMVYPDGRLALDGAGGYGSVDGGQTWQPANRSWKPAAPRQSDMLRLRPAPGGCGGTVEVWREGPLRIGDAARPGIDVCWVASAPAADGSWWIGGTRNGSAVLAVTPDRGATWRTVPLDAPAQGVGSVELASLGSHAYVAVLGPDRSIVALFHSADGAKTFTRTRSGAAGPPEGLAGSMVPLLDGRLLVASTDHRWYVSADDGATFSRAEGSLPAVGRLAGTPGGYVAYDLFGGGWAAVSDNGTTWHKLQIN